MKLTLAIDFGSTYTKVAAFDLEKAELVGTAQAGTTIDADITIGLRAALTQLETTIKKKGQTIEIQRMLSSSSAAGGLRMIAVGLTKALTTRAAEEAALGAGAKLIDAYSHRLTPGDIAAIEAKTPDLILLAGGVDGGNEENIIKNAHSLALSRIQSPIIIAGNKTAVPTVRNVLEKAGKYAAVVENILPELDRLNTGPARDAIREIFIARITHAKGLDKARQMTGGIVMPTPMAVLKGAGLLSKGFRGEPGWGDLMVIDVGGATTDVHSLGYGRPSHGDVILKGLPEPWDKRTVEGDLGIRCNAPVILEKIKEETRDVSDQMTSYVHYVSTHVAHTPRDEKEALMDATLAAKAVETAIRRHAGKIEERYFPTGKVKVQHGKDLTACQYLIGVGGVLAYGRDPYRVLKSACFNPLYPESLCPAAPDFFVDKDYILFAAGLLSEIAPLQALKIIKKSLGKIK
ncbi:MAG: methylaspartate mutase accessory protein GlmL [Candidatus Aminicenantes bacterium]|nr:methylaspartate mutase accessory protein GlmL [Candidatus Aminicenantes bacterium]